MGQPKGVSGNPNGRPRGVPNKVASPIKEVISNIVNDFMNNRWQDTFDQMDPKDQINAITKLSEFIVPKQSVVGVGIDDSLKDKLTSLFPFKAPE